MLTVSAVGISIGLRKSVVLFPTWAVMVLTYRASAHGGYSKFYQVQLLDFSVPTPKNQNSAIGPMWSVVGKGLFVRRCAMNN